MGFNVQADKLPQQHSSKFRNLDLVIEWPKDSVRVGEGKDGKKWRRTMYADYGYVRDSKTVNDHEDLDVYVGPNEDAEYAYIIEQLDDDGNLDEYKVMLGCDSLQEARDLYLKHYPEDWEDTHLGEIAGVPFEELFDTIEEHKEGREKTASGGLTLYHGTCPDSASLLCKNGWAPNQVPVGGNMGQSKFLYLSTGWEDAQWFAQEKGCDTVLEVRDIPLTFLAVDPEDGSSDTLEEELNLPKTTGLPGKVVLTHSLPANHFHVMRSKTAAAPMYHGTSEVNLAHIAREGLLPTEPDEVWDEYSGDESTDDDTLSDEATEPRLFASPYLRVAKDYAAGFGRDGVVLRLPGDLIWQEGATNEDYVYTTETVDPDRIDVLQEDGTWCPLKTMYPKQVVDDTDNIKTAHIVDGKRVDDSGAETGLRSEPDYMADDSYCKKMNDANEKSASIAHIYAEGLGLTAAAKPKCPHCGSDDYGLMPTDFETAKCNDCGKNWDFGIVEGINDPKTAKVARYLTLAEVERWGNGTETEEDRGAVLVVTDPETGKKTPLTDWIKKGSVELTYDVEMEEPDPSSDYFFMRLSGATITAHHEGVSVGSIEIRFVDTPEQAEDWELPTNPLPAAKVMDIHRDDNYKGEGVGQGLYDKAIEVAREYGCKQFYSDAPGCVSDDAHKAWSRLKERHPAQYDDEINRFRIPLDVKNSSISDKSAKDPTNDGKTAAPKKTVSSPWSLFSKIQRGFTTGTTLKSRGRQG